MEKVYLYEQVNNLVGKIGNKAKNVALMHSRGFNVPKGVIIPNFVFHDESIDWNNLQNELESKLQSTDQEFFCVRSSSNNEDLKNKSFAGQYSTFCGIRLKDLSEYAKKVVDSSKSFRAKSYLTHNNILQEDMAVLIQEFILCEKSGVLFTKNPLNNRLEECMLEAGYGLGELIVSGGTTPDNYVIDINTNQIKKTTGRQIEKQVFDGKQLILAKNEQKEIDCLNINEIHKIVKTGKRLEELFKAPQDIEWGCLNNKIYIFQSRDITT